MLSTHNEWGHLEVSKNKGFFIYGHLSCRLTLEWVHVVCLCHVVLGDYAIHISNNNELHMGKVCSVRSTNLGVRVIYLVYVRSNDEICNDLLLDISIKTIKQLFFYYERNGYN